jgi:transcriptional regulator with XRE-family HTH domain
MNRDPSTPRNWPALVSEVLDEARRHAGNGPLLAEELQQLGVGPEGRYSESAISNWIKGRAMPPADVLLAAATLGGISIDAKLSGTPATDVAGSEDVRRLSRELAQLQGVVMDLCARVGMEYPHLEVEDTPTTGTAQARAAGA